MCTYISNQTQPIHSKCADGPLNMKQHPDKKVLVVPRKLCSPGKENEVAVTDHTVEKRCKILPVDPSRLKILVENPVQYYKVLYTKFAANKVILSGTTPSFRGKSSKL